VRAKEQRKASKARALRVLTKNALQQVWRQLARLTKAIRRIPLGIDLVTVILIAWAIYQYRVVLIPVIQPDSAISSSWADLPITARNPGDLFTLRRAKFFCEITNVSWKGDENKGLKYKGYRIVGIAEYTVPDPPKTIAPGLTVTFPCDVSRNVILRLDGAQMPVALIHMSIKTTYDINLGLIQWHREAKSQLFTWREVSGGFQWLPGDTSDSIKPN
jgi:hypothetical protein